MKKMTDWPLCRLFIALDRQFSANFLRFSVRLGNFRGFFAEKRYNVRHRRKNSNWQRRAWLASQTNEQLGAVAEAEADIERYRKMRKFRLWKIVKFREGTGANVQAEDSMDTADLIWLGDEETAKPFPS